jgi:thiol-disulfide isomerase/thioredoxin
MIKFFPISKQGPQGIHPASPVIMVALSFLLLVTVSPIKSLAFQKGDTAPGFSLKTLSRELVSLDDFQGQMVILELGATWCSACRNQAEEIMTLNDYLEEKSVKFVEVFLQDTEEDIRKHVQQLSDAKSPIILIDDGSVLEKYQVFGIPRVLLIDANGKIILDRQLIAADELKRQIDKATQVNLGR